MNYCVKGQTTYQSCLKSIEWASETGITTLFKVQDGVADIAYQRRTNAIVSHSFEQGTSPSLLEWFDLQEAHHIILTGGNLANISSSDPFGLESLGDLMDDLTDALGPETNTTAGVSTNIIDTSAVAANTPSLLIPSVLHVVNITYPSPARKAYAGSNILHNILAIPLTFCSTSAAQNVRVGDLSSAIPPLSNSPRVSFAETRYTVRVGLWSIVAYAVVGSLLILFCLVTLVLATFHPSSSRLPDYGPYPLFNFRRWCSVEAEFGARNTVPTMKSRVQLAEDASKAQA